jgi:hypothetical protein
VRPYDAHRGLQWACRPGPPQRIERRLCPGRHPGAAVFWQLLAASDIYQAAPAQGNPEYFPVWAGQSVGLIHDLPSATEVVERPIHEARALLLERMPQAVQLSK